MSLIIPNELVYASPQKNIDIESNYQEFSPISGTSFNANDNIRFNISSNTHFLDMQKSYLKYDLYVNSTSASVNSYLGGTAPLYRISEQLGGLQISDVPNYNIMCALQNSVASSTKKNFLQSVEGYSLVQAFGTADSVSSSFGRKVCHSLRTPLAGVKQHLPLPFASLQIDITLDTLNQVIKNASGSAYTLKNVRFCAFLVKPSPEYLQQIQSAFSNGGSMKLPIEQIRSFTSKLTATTDQSLLFNIGVADSVRSFVSCQRVAASVNSATTDSFATFTLNALQNYYFNVSGKRVPQNFPVNCNNLVGNTQYSIGSEQAMLLCCSIDNDFSQLNWNQSVDTTNSQAVSNSQQFIYYPFASSRAFASGVGTRDGVVEIQLSYSSAPATTDVVNSFISMDAILEITNSSIHIRYTNL